MQSEHKKILSPEQISHCLKRILSSPSFSNSNILSNFLTFVVDETLAGRQKELKEYVIGLSVLAKKSDFNPQLDAIVRINAGRVRRALNEYYQYEGKNDEIVISIPKGSYSAVFSDQENLEREKVKSHVTIEKKQTVAVLPFININPDSPHVFFADGLADHISTELTRCPELSLISYYSCRNIAAKISDIREIALILNARYLLTGTVQSDKNHFHVTVQLIQSESGEQLWANTYERAGNVSELFNVQNEIVKQVVNQIAGNFGAISRNISRITSKNNIEDLNIYNAVFWYYHFINKNTEEIFHQAVAALRDAVKKDQEYALGWAILGDIYMGGHFLGFKDVNVNNLISEAIHCGRKSITVDPLCQQAYQTLALAFLFLHSKLECLTIIESWAKLKQGEAGISGGIGFCLICCGEYERGFKMISDSVELNPYYQWWLNGGASFYYYHKKDYDNCIHWAKKMNMADIPWELLLITASYAELGYSEEAKKMAFQIKKDFPFLQNILIDFVSAFLQDDALVQHILKGLKKAGLKEGSVN